MTTLSTWSYCFSHKPTYLPPEFTLKKEVLFYTSALLAFPLMRVHDILCSALVLPTDESCIRLLGPAGPLAQHPPFDWGDSAYSGPGLHLVAFPSFPSLRSFTTFDDLIRSHSLVAYVIVAAPLLPKVMLTFVNTLQMCSSFHTPLSFSCRCT